MKKELIAEIENHIGADIDSLLPPEFLLDETHPNNQSYLKTLKSIDSEIRGVSFGVKAQEIQTSLMAYRGDTTKEIAKNLNMSPATIGVYKRKDTFKKLIALYAYREQFSATPTQAMKENLLWEVANKNKARNPSVTVAAVRELIGNGSFWDIPLAAEITPISIMIQAPGAFLVLGLLLGFFGWMGSRRQARSEA